MQKHGDVLDLSEYIAESARQREAHERGLAEAKGMSLEEYRAHVEAERERQRVEADKRIAEQRRREVFAERSALLRASRVCVTSEDLEHLVRGDIRDTVATKHVRKWADGIRDRVEKTPRFLLLCGGVGVGKTFAAALAIVELGFGVAVRAPELGQRVDPWRHELKDGVQRLDLTQGLIVVDDLGTERADDSRFADAFARLVDERQASRYMLITTNLTRALIRPRYGDRIADRLNHSGLAIEIAGESMRKKGAL